MRKTLSFIICFTILITLLSTITVWAATSTLTGASSVRAGDKIILTLKAQGSGFFGFEGNISYDSSKLTIGQINTSLQGWKVELNSDKFVLYDDALTKPTSGTPNILTIAFTVKSSLNAGDSVKVSIDNLMGTDGSKETNFSTVAYETKLLPPKSTDATLSSLTISNATLAPAFSANVTSYATMVPFSTNSLSITAKTNHSGANYKINGNSLSVGQNNVTVVVTAESGATKTYTINVTRQQDPNYKESENANLSLISLSAGILSPGFSSERTEYISYLPFEIASIIVSGKAAEFKARSVSSETYQLEVGDNETEVVCTAEDGTTKKYNILVVRMPEFTTDVGDPGVSKPDVDTSKIESQLETSNEESDVSDDGKSSVTSTITSPEAVIKPNDPKNIIFVSIVIVILASAIFFVIGYKLKK